MIGLERGKMNMLVATPVDKKTVRKATWIWDVEQSRYICIFYFGNHNGTSLSKRVDFPRWISVA